MAYDTDAPPQPAKPVFLLVLLLLAVTLFAGLLALGVWQLQRLQWKLALIDRIEQRVHAAPVAPPGPSQWLTINRESNEYSRVQVTGRFDHNRATLVRASTELGRGFWVVTPLQTSTGFWVLVNRGFVASADSEQTSRPESTSLQVISGLLRLSEPGGSFLQANDAVAGRWYSRDVQAIAASVKLDAPASSAAAPSVAPYFIDASASPDLAARPRGGLTVLSFNNNHAVYAFTWFVLALMVAAAAAYLFYSERKLRSMSPSGKAAPVHA
jgi:surfeit locus 1 family protein